MNQVEQVSRDELAPLFERMSQRARRKFVTARDNYRPGEFKTRYLSKLPACMQVDAKTSDMLFTFLIMALVYGVTYLQTISHLTAAALGLMLGLVTDSAMSRWRQQELIDWLWGELVIQYYSARAGDAIIIEYEKHRQPEKEDVRFILDCLRMRYMNLRGITGTHVLNDHDRTFNERYPIASEMLLSMLEHK